MARATLHQLLDPPQQLLVLICTYIYRYVYLLLSGVLTVIDIYFLSEVLAICSIAFHHDCFDLYLIPVMNKPLSEKKICVDPFIKKIGEAYIMELLFN